MKLVVKRYPASGKGARPIELKQVRIYQNRNGQWCFGFDSVYCEPLSVEHITFNLPDLGSHAWNTCTLQIEEDTEHNTGAVYLCMVPESDVEEAAIDGVICVRQRRNAYSVCVVREEDFDEITEGKDK